MSDTSTDRDLALVIYPVTPGDGRDAQLRLQEAAGLAEALDMTVADAIAVGVRHITPGMFFGRGKVEELAAQVKALGARAVVVDTAVTPVQQRNLERVLEAKVLDRTGLILEIFARRARTKEGQLQVELARLGYERSRLVRTWTHLERQRGGRGFLAGPGETQIEADRRVIGERMGKLRRELEEVRRTRGLHRAQRRRVPFPLVALVGYTNAGKSSLFNALTSAGVVARDMPFATLDPTLRALRLPSGVRAMLSDTVGFISDLPPELVAAFEATLEEVREADLLVHVRDIAHLETDDQKRDVSDILERLRAGQEGGQPMIEVWNKADLLDADSRDVLEMRARRAEHNGEPAAVAASARTGEGIPDVIALIDATVTEGARLWSVELQPSQGRALAWLHAHGEVVAEDADEAGVMRVVARLGALAAGRFEREFAALAPADASLDAAAE
ncbi:MAG: GTPase HflX [Caulobacterales bacterium]|nr:GTPase HflX [Caulobacterales bacterium]